MDTINYKALLTKLARERGIPLFPEERTGLDVYLPLLERMREEGAVIVIKFDGERKKAGENGPYTAVVSGQIMEGTFFRIDTDHLEDALDYIIVNYASHQWGFDDHSQA